MPKKESFQFNSQTDKVLQMVINSVYTKREVFLRELVSNSIDAIEKRKYLASMGDDLIAAESGEYAIVITLDEKKKTISVADNGIGMDKDELINNLGTIAKSGTEEFLCNMENKSDMIGQFGVGFYSAYIVGSAVTVVTKRAGSSKGYIWESDGLSGYTVKECFDPCKEGTVVTVHLRDGMEEFLDKFRVKFIVDTYSSSSEVPIKIVSGDDIEVIANKPPLWTKDRKLVSPDEYQSFYKSLSHLPDRPLITIHYNVEGLVDFRSILFVPSVKPFNLFHPDRQTRVKLYTKKVFITEDQIQVLPKYLRFVYGVVDFDGLALNISRETVQAHGDIKKIETALVRKIYSELDSCRRDKPEDYSVFWQNFGNVLKEGLCENDTDKIAILNNCLFYTTKHLDKPISLQEYVDGMVQSEKEIYYCLGDSLESALLNPQLEAFVEQGIDVLLMVDPVDSFWINVVHSFNDYRFKSVSRSSTSVKNATAGQGSSSAEAIDDKEINKDEIVTLIGKALRGKVSDVRISEKLTESPACVSVADGSMDIAMERLLIEQNQLKGPSLKILEVNPKNSLIRHITGLLRDDEASSVGKEWANLILDTACIAQGDVLRNAGAFAKRLNTLVSALLDGKE